MIKVERSKVPEPESLKTGSPTKSKGQKETEAAKVHYDVAEPAKIKAFSFSAYKGGDVKLALDKLFHGKCAYCESVYANTQPMDVEHWRPKGEITRLDGTNRVKVRKPGYFWLAAVWTNLLPSCIDCNRQRNLLEMEVKDSLKMLEASGEAVDPNIPDNTDDVYLSRQDQEQLLALAKLGKKNLFPVKDDKYATDPETEVSNQEIPLILNPCEDDPKEYLEYVDEAVVRPRKEIQDDRRLTAENSILVYGLNRSRLVYERMERLLEIKARLYTLEQLAVIYEQLDLRRTNDKKIAKIVEDVIHHESRNLRRYMLREQPFCGMARQVIQQYFEKFN